MGNQQSQEQEVIFTQNGAGNSAATAVAELNDLNSRITGTNIFLIVIGTFLLAAVIYFLYIKFRNNQKEFIRKEVHSQFLRRFSLRDAKIEADSIV